MVLVSAAGRVGAAAPASSCCKSGAEADCLTCRADASASLSGARDGPGAGITVELFARSVLRANGLRASFMLLLFTVSLKGQPSKAGYNWTHIFKPTTIKK